MTLDVERPDPPRLGGPGDPGDYDAVEEPAEWAGEDAPREALAEMLSAGAWADAFEEWREVTSLTDDQFRVVRELGLIERFDFLWNPAAEDVGYLVPKVPSDRPDGGTLDRDERQEIEEELDELGRIVSDVLETDYVHRSSEEFGYNWE
ncbi:hypothetical protein [Halorientalis pallida]|uniref:DUF7992 domain-containing protein n=1 Tax=Halorientalis pallida TaxID=2479928 RepID=A0A498L7T3_9EURY|nr:hypothetical protein [Halorientalis pallida]RXK51835.1 hypothetical protein EAF64_04160 [Halorientalis pallida]